MCSSSLYGRPWWPVVCVCALWMTTACGSDEQAQPLQFSTTQQDAAADGGASDGAGRGTDASPLTDGGGGDAVQLDGNAIDGSAIDGSGDDGAGADAGGDTSGADAGGEDSIAQDGGGKDTAGGDVGGDDVGAADAGECKGDDDCAHLGGPCSTYMCNKGTCTATQEPDGGPCNDGNKCNSGGKCQQGECVGAQKKACGDDNPCTDDSCDSKTGDCVFSPNNAACDDGDACTDKDACAGGKCAAGKAKDCGDDNPCTKDTCKDGTCTYGPAKGSCDDGNPCTVDDSCDEGACTAKTPKTCDDSDPCTDDSCDPKKGCVTAANTAGCSDDAKCLIGVCKDGKCAVADKKGCNDNNPCTDDACGKGGCEYKAKKDGASCKDKDECQAASVCKKGACQAGAVEDCSDGNPCTTDTCDPKTGCLWKANKDACDDGDKCTAGDVCHLGACKKGAPIDVKKACDDGNGCTADTCDPAKGCVHAPMAAKCDDYNVCTAGEQCNNGQCGGGELVKCVDGKVCTIDLCDPKSGECAWGPKKGDCDDGKGCTIGDHCDKGSCVPTGPKDCADGNPCTDDSCDAKTGGCVHVPAQNNKAVACDDGSKCTKNDACKDGKCQGSGAPDCNDANTCTDDACDPKSGECVFKPRKGPCDNGDKCTFGDSCDKGKCITGQGLLCDDGSACTKDSCAAATGKCTFAPLKDGTLCDDGKKCTSGDHCAAGKCTAKSSDCALFDVTFDCGAKHSWTLSQESGHDVAWAVDQKPEVSAISQAGLGCTLNFNDGADYCDVAGNSCLKPVGTATSPEIDATGISGQLKLTIKTWYDTDAPTGDGEVSTDQPQVELIEAVGEKVIKALLLSKSKTGCDGKDCQQNLRHVSWIVPEAQGKKFRLRLSLASPTTSGNTGKGFFVDRVTVEDTPPPETCDDGKDNDGDGATDCADTECKSTPACAEDCSDGKDNDLDDAIDCKDSDCDGAIECKDQLLALDFGCNDNGWTFASNDGVNKWAIDATPATIPPFSGSCTLNFNNGKNYCALADCADKDGNASGGSATYGKTIDATGYKKVVVQLRSYDGTEVDKDSWDDYDRKWLQVSDAGFSGCSSTSTSCKDTGAACKATGTKSFELKKSKDVMNKWVKRQVDVSAWAGKKFTLRLRFATCDGKYNDFPGWFVDDLRVYGSK